MYIGYCHSMLISPGRIILQIFRSKVTEVIYQSVGAIQTFVPLDSFYMTSGK